MWDEVNQVKEEVNIMFDKVTSSNASQIENFVLVTFNDPDASKRTVTKKREEFKTALANITPHSYRNPDCAESAMEGIGLALRISMPHSYLYVFTDASAKDYARFEEIKSLSQKMGSQIVFLLTGECRNSGRFGPDYEVYHQLADATSGQVFNMMKDDVKDILKYIEETITGIGSKIVDKKFEPGYDKNLTYIVDPHTGDTLIAITGKEPKIGDVTGPGGSRPNTTHIVSGKSEMAVVKVTGAKPGEHVVSVGSMSGTHAVVSVKSTINFKLGFNVLKPKSSEDTVTRPPPKGNVFMGVKLIGTGVKLETVKILGMADEVIEELKLELVDEKTQFYVTPSFNPPSAMFRVTINGYDIDTKTPVTRRTPTPLSRQDMSAVVKVDTKPKVTIDGDTSITLYVDDPLELICKVHAYPEPEIIWEDKDLGTVIPAEKNMVEVPYDYVSVLKIDKGNRNTTYQCKANNRNGNDVQGVEIIARRRFYFDVIDSPKDIRIEYAKEGKLVCKIDAKPPATINWYKDAKPLSSSSRIEISKDQTVVTLKDMQPGMEGKFMCEARNDKERKVFHSHVEIFGIEKPNIDKSFDEIRVTEKTNGELTCRILKGIPKPTVTWSFRGPGKTKNLKETGETLQLKNAQRDQSGLYICTATNVLGTDNHETEVIVEYPPHIKRDVKEMKIVDGDEAKLTCDVNGVPAPTVYWTFNSINVTSTMRTQITADYSLIIKTTVADTGHYTCHADNKIGKDKRDILLEIYQKPVIDKSIDEIRVTEKTNGELSCRILEGIPKPTVTWSFRGPGKTKNLKETGETIKLKNTQRDQSGLYICTATNVLGTDNHETEVIVEYPPHIKRDVKEMKIVDGDEAKLTCDVNGVPAPTVYWTFNSINVTSTMRTQITDDYSLIIKTTVADTGHYSCHADNQIGKDKRDIFLEIYQKPVIDKSIDEIHITEKTNGELSCRILKGIPKPTITWVFRGPSKRKYLKETGETLQMKNAQRDQSGLYICTATNILGTDKHGTEVVVEYPPHIKRDVKEMKIVDGDEAKLTCDVNGVPAPTVYWTFNSINVTSTMRTQITDDYSLIIKTIVADTGHYACHADNKIGKDKRDIFLEIYQKPVIDKSIDEIRVTEKTNGELSCRILKGIPKPTITWVFRGPSKRKYLKETGETIKLKNAQRGQSGLYICTATNVLGTDNHETEVIVEYPPHIKRDVKEMKIVDGDEAKLSCDVIGVPAPTVYWTFNSINVTSTMRTQITADYSLKIKTTLYDIGHYVCHAKNKLGKGKKKVFLQVYVPVTIENPKSNIIKTMVGSGTLLNCIANGYPKPDIKWTFHRTLGAPGTDVTSSKHPSLLLQKLQLKQQGFYMCLAENAISGSASITYEVKVYAPPVIHNVYPSKLFEAIDGDMLLRIQCKATGSPTPTITWQKHGLNLAIGSDWFGMEDDGTLLIRNIDRATAGTYMCLAENSFGTASDYYEVVVKNSLVVVPSKTIYVQEGESVNIKCEIPYKITDQLRWFKNGKLRRERDEIYLFSATRSDDGVYTCRVSDLLKTRSIATKLVVGFKPIFSSDAEEIIEFVHKSESPFLDCEAYGEPRPTSATWTHDGVTMNVTDMSYVLGMELGATGIYECEVSNKFGSIRRSFNVTSRDCLLDIKKSFIGKHPVMFSTSGGWSVFRITKHHMIIPHKGYFYMRCPSGFVNPGLSLYSNIIACCERDNIVKIGRKPYNFADLQCNKEVTPNIEHTENKCFGDNTEYVGVGFKSQGYFMEVYRVCFDKVNDVPLFTKHHLSPHHTDISSTSQWFSSSDISAEEFEELYNCRRQLYDISIALRRRLRSDSCCYGRRQLVNPRDLLPGIPATASFEYKNVVPHWNSCSSKNWDDLEELVRELVKRAGRDLIVFTGTSNVNHDKLSVDIKINNGRERQQTIPLYLWKVVQDPATDSAIAIIQVNIPEITREEVMKNHVLCSDICNNIDWLEGPEWNDVDRGYTYCCNMKNFEKAFGYTRPITSMRRVLFDASLTPDTFLPL
ncbi:hemicentin-2-like isoform X1 [Spodoptera litura]|uniref:Hemolin n=1 Tax=Spodoptera litura TaxID=69820 RepID=A0A9J7E3S8_SPOLT|nr:hemicentin-2-like isoform X1 [Spodoptera litura]